MVLILEVCLERVDDQTVGLLLNYVSGRDLRGESIYVLSMGAQRFEKLV